jgi:hypothetical protein
MADESERRFFNSVPTSLQLPAKTVDRLKRLAAVELNKNAEFQRLILDLGRAGSGFWRDGHVHPPAPSLTGKAHQ